MSRTKLTKRILKKKPRLFEKDVALATREVIKALSDALVAGERIEIRGFGTFALKSYRRRDALNPKTGERVHLNNRSIPQFRVSKVFHKRLNAE